MSDAQRVYRTTESPADKAAQLAALRLLVAQGRCLCGASDDLVRRQYKVGGEYRWFWECRDQVRCQEIQRRRITAQLAGMGE